MTRILTLCFVLTISSSRLNFSAAQVQISHSRLPNGFSGSEDFAYEGVLNDGSAPIAPLFRTTSTTTILPTIKKCIDNCLASATIIDNRPVCGSDSVTYDNHQHFDCTLSCGKNGIQKVYTDRCS
ncbi:uncharacterized protein LOC117171755 [Belonocnema kinseyi]|uniref:uncharacterized protein LOC117171755 n=1 Tax=Belonocnema kinseyi TaxID=2817044 RepID=UPI00143CFFD6|nr:uncharacterized protein LOC117171755 [Belonocnema kinseyi]